MRLMFTTLQINATTLSVVLQWRPRARPTGRPHIAGHWAVGAPESVFCPQQPRNESPFASWITERYCPGQLEGGLLARGNISHVGWLGKGGGVSGGVCAQPGSRVKR